MTARSKPLPQEGCTTPIMLMHGFGAFLHVLSPVSLTPLVKELRSLGYAVEAPLVPPYETVPVRARAWKSHLDALLTRANIDRVHLIGFSSGGLDARYLVSKMDFAESVASLTTISTPHRGSSVAKAILDRPEHVRRWLVGLANWMGGRVYASESSAERALEQLTPEYVLNEFNAEVKDVPAVLYTSWAGRAGIGTDTPINPLLRPTNRLVFDAEGVNDGIVSVESARWTGFKGFLEADHGRQIGIKAFNGSFDPATFISEMLSQSETVTTRPNG